MNTAYLSIGSNMGDRESYLREAVQALAAMSGIFVRQVSSIYETVPVGYTDQADFLNIAVHLETTLSPEALLDACQEIEQTLGRERLIRWGPRTVDLDILLYNQDNIEMERLLIPHPRMKERAFVLIPLLEIAPNINDSISGIPLSEEAAAQETGVYIWKQWA